LARLKGFQKLTAVDDAVRIFFSKLQAKPPKPIIVKLHSALDRVLAEDIVAGQDLPRFDRSAVDGYAVKAEDIVDASQFKPKTLRITNKNLIIHKQTKQLWTGTPIPKGANAVVMLENTGRTEDKIEVWTSATPGENISKRGEDLSKGEIAVKAGTRLKPHHLGLIGALGRVRVAVAEKPKVAILATGNELAELGAKLREHQVFDVNRLVLSALSYQMGAEPLDLGIAKDHTDEISEKLKFGLERADAVITSGGTSVGGADLVPEAVNNIGKPGIVVHGVGMRPGMPTALAVAKEKPIVILPGNPVAAMIGFEVFCRPLICRMLGLKSEPRPTVQAKMNRRIATTLGRKNFVRVYVFKQKGEHFAEPISARGSSMISTMTRANGYVVVPENREGLEEGEYISVQLFDKVEVTDENV
jgi:molybdopterin molybdotransferase